VHDLLDGELLRRATLAGLDLPALAASSEEVRELAMTRHLIGEWLTALDER
jgi:hypothetical protein